MSIGGRYAVVKNMDAKGHRELTIECINGEKQWWAVGRLGTVRETNG